MNKPPFSFSIEKTKKGYTIVTLSYTPPDKKSQPLTVKVAPELGSNMFMFRFGKHDELYHDPKLLEACKFTGNFVLFPTPNRVRNFAYTWKGKTTAMKKRGKTVEIHGLVFDETWEYETPTIENNSVTLKTSITITKTSPLWNAFPFLCTLTLRYRLLATGVEVGYAVKNTGNEDVPFGFALHPYFNLLSGPEKTTIHVPAKYWMESPKDTLLPTGKLVNVDGKPYDLRKPVAIEKLNLDHVFTGLTPKQCARIHYPAQKFAVLLKTSPDFTHVVVYTGDRGVVCVENQTCSTDAHNLWAKGYKKESHLLTVPAGKTHKGFIRYEIIL